MKLTRRSGLADVALCVGKALETAGIRAVLTGGACASLYSRGRYESSDLDFVVVNEVRTMRLDAAMEDAGFLRKGGHYEHPEAAFFVEFFPGPLAVGEDAHVRPAVHRIRKGRIMALSPTDSCRDRLAAFFHWNDRHGLRAAVEIAHRQAVDLKMMRAWSIREGALDKFEQFVAELERMAPGKKASCR